MAFYTIHAHSSQGDNATDLEEFALSDYISRYHYEIFRALLLGAANCTIPEPLDIYYESSRPMAVREIRQLYLPNGRIKQWGAGRDCYAWHNLLRT